MTIITAPSIEIQTCPADVPTIPPWFAEVVVLARHFTQQGYLAAISEQVRLARGRAGIFEVLDFVVLLLGYAVSDERTLDAFFDRLAPFALPFMALFGRNRLPVPSTLSRFLAAVDRPCLEALRQRFLHDRLQHGFKDDQLGGFFDAQGRRLLVFDIDGTRQAARQRALASTPDLPPVRRRLDAVCAPGYRGRKRGEVVRTRTTVLQAHTQEWLGTFANRGNGDYAEELLAACQAITAYLTSRGVSPADALLRLDGLYGSLALLLRLLPLGLGFLVRGRDYRLLDQALVQARLQQPADANVTHLETQVQRELFDVGFISDWLPEHPEAAVSFRVLVTRRAAPADPTQVTVGKLRDGHVYELFLTSQPATSLPAVTVLELYQHRGSFEQVLSDEDDEHDPDRWCSRTPCGQEFAQVLSQWVWNTRLSLGSVSVAEGLRWTTWETPPPAPAPQTRPGAEAPGAPAVEQAQEEPAPPTAAPATDTADTPARIATYGPLRLSHDWVKAPRPFSAQAFTVGEGEGDTLRCPAGKVLRPYERRAQSNGELRVVYAAKVHDCRSCDQAEACLGTHEVVKRGRRVSGTRQITGWQEPPQASEPPIAEGRGRAPDSEEVRVLQWGDGGGRRVRRDLITTLRRQQVTITRQERQPTCGVVKASPHLWTRAERAHRRQSWACRRARNAATSEMPSFRVIVCGIAPALAAHLGLPSTPVP
jgi:hypothetical protein